MAEKEFKIIIENKENGGVADDKQPSTMQQNPLGIAQQVLSSVPYGNTISSAIGQGQSIASGISNLAGASGALGIALVALKVAKKAHEIASKYVKDVRQSKELQRRAGFYRRGND